MLQLLEPAFATHLSTLSALVVQKNDEFIGIMLLFLDEKAKPSLIYHDLSITTGFKG